jgi:hypothetical protein
MVQESLEVMLRCGHQVGGSRADEIVILPQVDNVRQRIAKMSLQLLSPVGPEQASKHNLETQGES